MNLKTSLLLAPLALFASSSMAATVTLNFTESFGQTAPDGPAPWATAVITDTGADTVELTMSVANTVGLADVTQMYFNIDPYVDLSFSCTSGECAATATSSLNAYKADGDGFHDILFDWETGDAGETRLNAGESAVYTITGTGLDALDFRSWSEPGGGQGVYLAVAKFQDTGYGQQDSDWVGAVPVPAAVWLFGSGLLGLVGVARRKRS